MASVSIVMPALNEEAVVAAHVSAVREHPGLQSLSISQIVVVDNGSTDGTAAVAMTAGATVISESRRGYGAACLAGVLATKQTDIVLLMDADGSDDLTGAIELVRLVAEGKADLAIGARSRGTLQHGALTIQQRAGNAVGAYTLRTLFGVSVSDIGPMRAIRREALLNLRMSEMTYGWSTEMIVKAARAGYRVVEVPVDYHCRRGGQSKVSGTILGSVSAGWSMLTTIIRHVRWQPEVSPQKRQAVSETLGSR